MKVTSRRSIDFPGFKWAITAGVPTELPEDKEQQKVILAHPHITKVK